VGAIILSLTSFVTIKLLNQKKQIKENVSSIPNNETSMELKPKILSKIEEDNKKESEIVKSGKP